MKFPMSENLHTTLARVGWWKLAQEVHAAEGVYVPAEVTVPTAVDAIAHKLAADWSNEIVIEEGLEALGRVLR